MGRGLLSRLGSGGSSPPGEDVRRSIADHLQVLLNSRQGDARTVPDYGVVDFADVVHSLPGSLSALQASIRDVIATYEPRIKNPTVRLVPSEDALQLRFEISGQLAEGFGRGALRFHTRLKATGRFDVQG